MKLEDVLEVFPILIPKKKLDQFFSFGDVKNVVIRLVKFHSSPIIIWRIWMSVLWLPWTTLWEGWSNIIDLTMNLERCFKIQSGLAFFLNQSGDRCCQITRCNCWISDHICGHPCLNSHWRRQFEFIMIVWSNILNLVSIPFWKIIIGSSSIWIMIMAMFAITSPH
jgi:hypothetical protein